MHKLLVIHFNFLFIEQTVRRYNFRNHKRKRGPKGNNIYFL